MRAIRRTGSNGLHYWSSFNEAAGADPADAIANGSLTEAS